MRVEFVFVSNEQREEFGNMQVEMHSIPIHNNDVQSMIISALSVVDLNLDENLSQRNGSDLRLCCFSKCGFSSLNSRNILLNHFLIVLQLIDAGCILQGNQSL